MCHYLRVVHVPHKVALLRVQDKVAPQELAAALILLDIQKAADAVLSVHVRHGAAGGTFPSLLGPGGDTRGRGVEGGWRWRNLQEGREREKRCRNREQ